MLGAALGRLRRDVSKVLGVGGVPGGANLPGRKVSRWCHSGSGDLSRLEVKPASRVPGAPGVPAFQRCSTRQGDRLCVRWLGQTGWCFGAIGSPGARRRSRLKLTSETGRSTLSLESELTSTEWRYILMTTRLLKLRDVGPWDPLPSTFVS